jgi:hypothetical protein
MMLQGPAQVPISCSTHCLEPEGRHKDLVRAEKDLVRVFVSTNASRISSYIVHKASNCGVRDIKMRNNVGTRTQ